MFKAVLYRKGLELGIIMFDWPKPVDNSPPLNGRPTLLYNRDGFAIQRYLRIEIRAHTNDCRLWLPGTNDAQNAGPLMFSTSCYNEAILKEWIKGYSRAYRELNGKPPKIIDLLQDPDNYLEMETVG